MQVRELTHSQMVLVSKIAFGGKRQRYTFFWAKHFLFASIRQKSAKFVFKN
jgi:hypothetical protein